VVTDDGSSNGSAEKKTSNITVVTWKKEINK